MDTFHSKFQQMNNYPYSPQFFPIPHSGNQFYPFYHGNYPYAYGQQAMSVMPYTNNIHFMPSHHINYQPQPPQPQPQPPKSDDITSPGILRSSISSVEISRVGGPSNDSDAVTYHCEPCDKSFKCVRSYETHLQSHEACKHAGCSFQGSKKVVISHFHSTHGQYNGTGYKMIDVEGQKFKVLLGTSPDEVEQWRAERKKRFPTEKRTQQLETELSKNQAAGGLSRKRHKEEDALSMLAEDYSDIPDDIQTTSGQKLNGKRSKTVNKRQKLDHRKKTDIDSTFKAQESLLCNLLKNTTAKTDNIILQCIRLFTMSKAFQE